MSPENRSKPPENQPPNDVFKKVVAEFLAIGNTVGRIKLTAEKRQPKIADALYKYFQTGAEYFAQQGHTPYLKTIGSAGYLAVKHSMVSLLYVNDVYEASLELGLDPAIAARALQNHDEPHVLAAGKFDDKVYSQIAAVLVPPEFFIRAQKEPILALATTLWMCSQIRDLVNGRERIDLERIHPRAEATEADFLHYVAKSQPNIELSGSYSRILSMYPLGIRSLPSRDLYRGIQLSPGDNAARNN